MSLYHPAQSDPVQTTKMCETTRIQKRLKNGRWRRNSNYYVMNDFRQIWDKDTTIQHVFRDLHPLENSLTLSNGNLLWHLKQNWTHPFIFI